ncbi:WD repeat-containing protein 76 [Phtheirospermum japonicum]|uniref:WD repeat-containing protein 76 n=1 Tax=Phtheirospermum japonicum TaxID=374723 RepID=A0A830BVX9_9LAMI|nr:WD repeat-containing protein 76 [Phtheirospermum japonicum]
MGKNEKMTEYERRRLENIKRNDEMLAALKIHSRLSDLSAAAAAVKRQRAHGKSYKRSPVKKSKSESPVVLRRSLRTRGVPPDAATAGGLNDDMADEKKIKKIPLSGSNSVDRKSPRVLGPLAMRDAYTGDDGLDQKLIKLFHVLGKPSEMSKTRKGLSGAINVEPFQLDSENIARVVPGRIMSLRFFPTLDMKMVAVGNKFGNIGFWNFDGKKEDGDGIYLFHPHSGPVSGIVIDRFSISKMYSSCYDGFIRMMDVEKEMFDMVYYSEYAIYTLALSPHDTKSLYFSEGKGGVNKWDLRAGKSLLSCDLHEDRINTIDFNSENESIIATSSTDGTACIWDMRYMNADKPEPLKTVRHERAVHSAYFSPTGKFLATTSVDDNVGLSSGANYETTSMVYHYNQTGRWISTFRGIWGWDDSSIYIGNMNRGVDVISVPGKKIVATLESDLLSAIPCRFDAHPYTVGMLAGATSGGQHANLTRCFVSNLADGIFMLNCPMVNRDVQAIGLFKKSLNPTRPYQTNNCGLDLLWIGIGLTF